MNFLHRKFLSKILRKKVHAKSSEYFPAVFPPRYFANLCTEKKTRNSFDISFCKYLCKIVRYKRNHKPKKLKQMILPLCKFLRSILISTLAWQRNVRLKSNLVDVITYLLLIIALMENIKMVLSPPQVNSVFSAEIFQFCF